MLKIIDLPSPNFFPATVARPIRAIVCHGTAGPLWPSINWLRNPRPDNPGAAVSANYVISLSGDVYQLVDWRSGLRAYGNGVVRSPDKSLEWLLECRLKKINPNLVTISIEHEASNANMVTRGRMSDPQFNSSTELVVTLARELGLPLDSEHINGHYQIDSQGKANCPGVINIPAYIEVLNLRKEWYK
jgi:N-acetylmuramoyl-L-alanine amidase